MVQAKNEHLIDAWEKEISLGNFCSLGLVIFEGFEENVLLLLSPHSHDDGSGDSEHGTGPGLGHDGVDDPGADLPAVICAEGLVEAPSLS